MFPKRSRGMRSQEHFIYIPEFLSDSSPENAERFFAREREARRTIFNANGPVHSIPEIGKQRMLFPPPQW